MQKLIYFSTSESSFVKRDIESLRGEYRVESYVFSPASKWLTPFSFLRQFAFLFYYSLTASAFISRFAGHHSLLPSVFGKIFRVKHYIILGGTDCNALPSIGYGHALKPLLKWSTKTSMKLASKLLPISQSLVHSRYTYTDNDGKYQGFQYHYHDVQTPYEVIPIGIEADLFKILPVERMPNTFLTICSGLQSERRRLTKGIDLFIEISQLFPQYEFHIIGDQKPDSLPSFPNVKYIPFCENHRLPELLNAYSFYMQLSLTEGFSNALIEAMACGCIPIVSNVGPMPEVVGEHGFVLKNKNIGELYALIITLTAMDFSNKRPQISNHIRKRYSMHNRKTMLIAELANNTAKG